MTVATKVQILVASNLISNVIVNSFPSKHTDFPFHEGYRVFSKQQVRFKIHCNHYQNPSTTQNLLYYPVENTLLIVLYTPLKVWNSGSAIKCLATAAPHLGGTLKGITLSTELSESALPLVMPKPSV